MQERRFLWASKEGLTMSQTMPQSHYDCPCMEKCPLHHAMQLIGGKWKVQILCAVANAGAIRYNALRSKLDGISNTVLASALITALPIAFSSTSRKVPSLTFLSWAISSR